MDQTFPSPAAPADRADAPVSETAERFLRGILQRLPLSRIEELHLFSPLRQGTVETGIAVVAARPAPRLEETRAEAAEAVAADAAAADAAVADAAAADAAVADAAAADAAAADADVTDMDLGGTNEQHSAPPDAEAPVAEDALAAEPVVPTGEAEAPVVPPAILPAPRRHEVYTARYRLVIKGPDRGKWEADLVAEADAPLVTVETVVRGVQRRAGEATDTVRYGAAQVARALRLPPPAP